MTIELTFDSIKTLKLLNSIIAKGMQKFTENVPEQYYDECINSVDIIENITKPIREAIDEVNKKEKYLEYLQLKEKFEGKN